jgi:hypothetical protein
MPALLGGGTGRSTLLPGLRDRAGRALAEYERLGNPFEAARTREYLAETSPAEQRAPVLEAAIRQYEQLGAPYSERVRASMAVGV